MEHEPCLKNLLSASIFEYSCKNNFTTVIKKVLKDEELCSNLHVMFTNDDLKGRQNTKPIFLLMHILRQLLSSVETFAIENTASCYPWNSNNAVAKIINLLEKTYAQCEFISLKKFFSLLSELKFLDLMHLLQLNVDSSTLMQKLNLYFPRWQSSEKASLEKQFLIENSKILHKVEESYSQCRRLILKLAADSSYKALYMKEQFSADVKKMTTNSAIHLKEIISNLKSNAGLTAVEKNRANPGSVESSDLGFQLLLDYLQPEITPEGLLRFLDEMEPALQPPSGGFSSCLLPFDALSECSDTPMDSENEESDSECSSEESCGEKDKTLMDISCVETP